MIRRVLTSFAFVLVVAMLLPLHPGDVSSLGAKIRAPGLDMSPMGRIAAGYDPIPQIEIPQATPAFNAQVLSPQSMGGTDRLTHSPTAADFQSETSIAKFGNAVVVGFNDVRGFVSPPYRVSGYAYSADGGATWTDGGQLPTTGSNSVYGDPDDKVWQDPNTLTVYFVYSSIYLNASSVQGMCVHVSTDGGATWTDPRPVTPAAVVNNAADKEYIDIDPETGRLFISWTNFPNVGSTSIRTAYSDDFGLTWSAATSFTSASGQGSIPRAAGNGSNNVYITWNAGGSLSFVRSIDNGATWGAPSTIVGGLVTPMNPYGSDRIHGFPIMSVDRNNGNVYIVYASRNLPPDFSDIYFMRSTNGGTSFSGPVAINSSPGNDRAQFFPCIAADESDGSVSAIWYDQRAGTGTSDLTELVHTRSVDGGLTWTCPTALSDRPFHAEAGNKTSQPNIGDYIQCVSQGGTLYSVFGKTDFQSWTTYSPDTYVDVTAPGTDAAPLGFDSFNFTDIGCSSGNGYMEPGETIFMTVTLRNIAGCGGLTGITGVLTAATPGVTITTPSDAFTDAAAIGSLSTNTTPFEVTIGPGVPCGTKIDFVLDYSATGFASATMPFEATVYVGHPVATVLLNENFDGVTAPALPGGWTSSLLQGTSNPWRTSTTYAASGSNSAFCFDITTTSLNELKSPHIPVPAGTKVLRVELDETHNPELDVERRVWDGGVMRVLLGGTKYFSGGAGNMTPFYPWQISRAPSSLSPLQDLACWGGNTTPNFAHYVMDFPDMGGESINLLFDMSTDSNTGTATGQFIDNVVVTAIDYQCDCSDQPMLVVTPSSVNFGNVPVNTSVCDTLMLTNEGAADLNISAITGCDAPPFTIDTSGTSLLLAPGQSTTMIVCAMPTSEGTPTCNILIASDDPNGPAVVPVQVDLVTAAGAQPLAFDRVTVVPNPFNPETTIRFTLPARAPVTAQVWSVDGKLVRTLAHDRPMGAGVAELRWDGVDNHGVPVASGIYFVRVKSTMGERVARAVLLK